ncbi:MAG: putative Dynein heavy chain 10, axonemal [Streblomastix strix]|uniref:Putative Dynein heavy chain 10, axonemal n=1 Tax=Streblomastix strix TaxID=222440 RepID=A0A5J4UXT1_9EUKA|nr:MAG: putative Dynein heavy chain 10, axonemal [Streblomastix strix]
MNLPKFVYEDVPLFMGLIKDLYPDLELHKQVYPELLQQVYPELPQQVYPELNESVESVLKKNNYVVTETKVLKVVQLYDTMFIRQTTMVVGPSNGGKTVVIPTLQEAQTKLGYPTKLFVLNPKSITNNDLYGVYDTTTNDWQDGLLSNIFRNINTTQMEKRERIYIVYDGDVDAHWVENMNSVKDDNRLLTLLNKKRIVLRKECSMLFEVGNLKYASPATVSRCGMVYVDPHDHPPHTIFMRWLASRPKEEQESLRTWHDRYIPRCFEYIFDGTINGVPVQPPEEEPEVEKPKNKEVHQYTAMAFNKEKESQQPAKKEEIMLSTQKGVGEDGKLLQAIPQTAVSEEVQLCNIYQALVPTD